MNIDLARADLNEEDIEGVLEVLRSGRLAMGPKTEEFEHLVAEHAGVKHGIAVSSGTAGLHLILAACGIGRGDEVIVPSFTFAASANAILMVGATPVFCDIDPDTFNLDPADVERRITERTRAVMAVDVFGHPAPWDELTDLAKRHNLILVDDSCEALGSEYHGKPIGSFGDAACFAFYPNKQITTGEGGMIVTDSDEIARLARSLRNQGRDAMGSWLEHARLGFNYRLDEMSAALGASQMRRLPRIVEQRRQVARMYGAALGGREAIRLPTEVGDVKVSWFVYVILVDTIHDRDSLMRSLSEQGIPTRTYFPALHLQPYLQTFRSWGVHLPVTKDVAQRTLALPFHTMLDNAQISLVSKALATALATTAGLNSAPPSLAN